MCGRFSLTVNESELNERFGTYGGDSPYVARYNCAPTQQLPVITNTEPEKLNFFRWGLIPFWAKDKRIGNKLINARAETLDKKGSFKHPFRRKRCLVPSDGFYEWKRNKEKIPHRIIHKGNNLFSMAGIWDSWKDESGATIHTFSIITTQANDLVKSLHDRMPVILSPDHEKAWLELNNTEDLKSLLVPYPSDNLEAYPVSKAVNSPYNDSPEIIERINGKP
ncbi:MAG: SOS response-associated peptidase [Bacteroidales bacterium]|nr:SOS response-associated peptidase [Bacteroidales bacterium]